MAKASAVKIPQLTWEQVRPAPVVLVSGPESFLADRASRRLRDILALEDPSLEVHDLRADEYAPGGLATYASPSLFGEPRLVRVESVEKCSDAFLVDALDYIERPAEGAVLLLRHGGGTRGKRLLDALRGGAGNAIEVACAELKNDRDRLDFAAAEFRLAGRRIPALALRQLVAAVGGDLAGLAAACRQLMSDEPGDITEETVTRYYSGRVEAGAFAVVDAAIAGRTGEALGLLRHAVGTGVDAVPLVAAFAMKIRSMAKVQGVSGGSGQLAAQLGMAPWQVDRARRDAGLWSEGGIGRTLQLIAETDELVKGGSRDQVYALERLVLGVASRGERI